MVTNFIANLQFFSQRHEKHMLILKVTHALQMLTSSHNFVEMLLGDLSKVKMAICPCKTFSNKRYHHENEKSVEEPCPNIKFEYTVISISMYM